MLGNKVYERNLSGMNSSQILFVDEEKNTFVGIGNIEHGSHTTLGFLPNDYETGAEVPRGFYKKHGFKPKYVSEQMEMYGEVIHGNQCGEW